MRKSQIETNTGHKVFVIDCREDLTGIHNQIRNLVSHINKLYTKQNEKGTFKPWRPDNEYNPIYWKEKGIISTTDEISFHTIDDICLLFGADSRKTKRGFLRKGGIYHPVFSKLLLWWPSERKRSGWQNNFDEINSTITETHSDHDKKIQHYLKHSNENYTRIVFFHYKDILGLTNYKFVGIYTNDKEKSNENIGTVWKKYGETINLKTGEISNKI